VPPPKPPPVAAPAATGEEALIDRLASLMYAASGPPPPGQIWIGDDAAVVPPPTGPLVLATDAVVEGVHADLSVVGLDDLGWKAMAASLSDIGAMGARPLQALVTICFPAGTDVGRLATGVAAASAEWGCPVVGGDLSTASEVVVSVAVTGVLDGERPAVTRGGAAPGDVLLVTGPLGASAAGLRILQGTGGTPVPGRRPEAGGAHGVAAALVRAHRRPSARVTEGVVARRAGAVAMIDVSDGLSIDLHRLADASGVGFRLDDVPVARGATLAEAVGGGEDYELVIATADPAALEASLGDCGLRPPLVIGRCVADPAERTLAGEPLPRLGWEHPVG